MNAQYFFKLLTNLLYQAVPNLPCPLLPRVQNAQVLESHQVVSSSSSTAYHVCDLGHVTYLTLGYLQNEDHKVRFIERL